MSGDDVYSCKSRLVMDLPLRNSLPANVYLIATKPQGHGNIIAKSFYKDSIMLRKSLYCEMSVHLQISIYLKFVSKVR